MGNGCPRVPSWLRVRMGLHTCSSRKALEELYPPSLHRWGKGMKDKGMISSRLGTQITAEQRQPLPLLPPAKSL